MSSINTIFISLLGGVMPALIWLWFWLKEDRLHPEPKSKVIAVFLTGMISVLVVLPLEKMIFTTSMETISLFTIFSWASIEEIAKYLAAFLVALRSKANDEPIDAVIYMITVALGFSALENTLFIFNLVESGNFVQSIMTGNSRFLGATLLHIASSATIGAMVGLAYYKRPLLKGLFLFMGVVLSIMLHTIFNLLIIKFESGLFFVFAGVWTLIILLLIMFEKIKKIRS